MNMWKNVIWANQTQISTEKGGGQQKQVQPLLSHDTLLPHFIPTPGTRLFTFLRPPHVHLNII